MKINQLKPALFPEKIKPMSPTLIKEPFDSPDFIYEIKWDGFRAVTFIHNSEINIYSRKGFPFNKKFPTLIACFKKIKKNIIFDGEIVVIDNKGRAEFEALRYYSPKSKKSLYYYIFDILYYDQFSLMNLPLIDRKKMLKKVLSKEPTLMYVDHIESNGTAFFKLAEQTKIEGIVAKRKDSLYLPGIRTKDWLKIKTKSHKAELEKFPREF